MPFSTPLTLSSTVLRRSGAGRPLPLLGNTVALQQTEKVEGVGFLDLVGALCRKAETHWAPPTTPLLPEDDEEEMLDSEAQRRRGSAGRRDIASPSKPFARPEETMRSHQAGVGTDYTPSHRHASYSGPVVKKRKDQSDAFENKNQTVYNTFFDDSKVPVPAPTSSY